VVVHLDMRVLGVNWHERRTAHDPITGEHENWAQHDVVRLGRAAGPVHVIHVERERHETPRADGSDQAGARGGPSRA
jgi:hypothetical protein